MRAIPGVEMVTPEEYRRTIFIDGHDGVVAVRPVRGSHSLQLDISYPNPSALFRIVERMRRLFDVGADPAEVAAHLRRDPALERSVRARPGLRVPGCWDGFELSVRAILGQQVSVKGASTMAGRLAARFGSPVPGTEGVQFPGAATLADADLTSIGVTRRRSASIRGLATAVVQGAVAFDGRFDADGFEKSITAIPGIGPWTAQYIAMRLGEPDAFPSSDLYLRHIGARSEAWRPWRAYAAMHLWKAAGEKQ